MPGIKEIVHVRINETPRLVAEVIGNEWPPHDHWEHGLLDADDHLQYLLLTAGPDRALTGDLYIDKAVGAVRGTSALAFSDHYNSLSTWVQDHVTLADSQADWGLARTTFGEVSLLAMISAAAGMSDYYVSRSGGTQWADYAILYNGAGITLSDGAHGVYIANDGVISIAKSGSTALGGAVTLSEGANITLTQVGQDIEIAASGGGTAALQATAIGYGDGTNLLTGVAADLSYDSTTKEITTTGGIVNPGTLLETATKNRLQILMKTGSTPYLVQQTHYWNGSSFVATDDFGVGLNALLSNTAANTNAFGYSAARYNAGTNTNAFGHSAAGSNTAANTNAFGYSAAQYNTGLSANAFGTYAAGNNTGPYTSAVGYSAARYNTGPYTNAFGYFTAQFNAGTNTNAFGYYSARNNIGSNTNAFGYSAARYNAAANTNAFGTYAAQYNIGPYTNAFGYSTARYNIGSNTNAFGTYAAQYNAGANNTVLGSSAWSTFLPNTAGDKTFDYADVNVDDTITITAHGFGSVGDYTNVLYTEGTGPITGLSDGAIVQIEIIDANTVKTSRTNDITAVGTGTGHTFTPQMAYENCVVVGANATPTATNQVLLGNHDSEQVKLFGTVYIGDGYAAADEYLSINHAGTFAEMLIGSGGLSIRGAGASVNSLDYASLAIGQDILSGGVFSLMCGSDIDEDNGGNLLVGTTITCTGNACEAVGNDLNIGAGSYNRAYGRYSEIDSAASGGASYNTVTGWKTVIGGSTYYGQIITDGSGHSGNFVYGNGVVTDSEFSSLWGVAYDDSSNGVAHYLTDCVSVIAYGEGLKVDGTSWSAIIGRQHEVSLTDKSIVSGSSCKLGTATYHLSLSAVFGGSHEVAQSSHVSYSFVSGSACVVEADYGAAIGLQVENTHDYATVLGRETQSLWEGALHQGGDRLGGGSTYSQSMMVPLVGRTTDASEIILKFNTGDSLSPLYIPEGYAIAFDILLFQSSLGTQGMNTYRITGHAWNVGGSYMGFAVEAGSYIPVCVNGSLGGNVVLDADPTNDVLQIKCTGIASTTIDWSAHCRVVVCGCGYPEAS